MKLATARPISLDATPVALVDHGGGTLGLMVGARPVPNLTVVRTDYEGGDPAALRAIIGGAFAIDTTTDELTRWGPAMVAWAEGIGANGALSSTFAGGGAKGGGPSTPGRRGPGRPPGSTNKAKATAKATTAKAATAR